MPLLPEEIEPNPARRAFLSLYLQMSAVMEVAAARQSNPQAFPIVPTQDVALWATRRVLADFVELGFEPEGWREVYMSDPEA